MRDRRRTPFFYVTIAASRRLREAFPMDGPRRQRTIALAIYAAMCEVANEQHSRGPTFTAPRKLIAEYAGVAMRTLDTFVPRLCEAGLIDVERRQERGVHLPHEWSLIDVTLTTLACGGGAAGALPPGGGASGAPVAQPVHEGLRSECARGGAPGAPLARGTQEVKQELQEPPNPPEGGRKRDSQDFEDRLRSYAEWLLPEARTAEAVPALRGAITGGARTTAAVLSWLEQWRPDLAATCPRRP